MQDLELDWVERKESLPKDKDKIYQALCAFMNDMPVHRHSGLIFIGVSDDGEATGLAVTDDLLTTLGQMRSDGSVQPIPDLEVQPRMLRGARVAVMEVYPVSHPPARFKGQTWIRIGPTRAIATPDQERRLTEKRVSAAQTFDQQPCLHASLADLHLAPFAKSISRAWLALKFWWRTIGPSRNNSHPCDSSTRRVMSLLMPV